MVSGERVRTENGHVRASLLRTFNPSLRRLPTFLATTNCHQGRRTSMPRVLHRFLDGVTKAASLPSSHKIVLPSRKRRRITLYQPPQAHPNCRVAVGDRSILLEEGNPLSNKARYARHKRTPPVLRGAARERKEEEDRPRLMSEEERAWYADPWCASIPLSCEPILTGCALVRMLSGRLRFCFLTHRYLPRGMSPSSTTTGIRGIDRNTRFSHPSRRRESPPVTRCASSQADSRSRRT